MSEQNQMTSEEAIADVTERLGGTKFTIDSVSRLKEKWLIVRVTYPNRNKIGAMSGSFIYDVSTAEFVRHGN